MLTYRAIRSLRSTRSKCVGLSSQSIHPVWIKPALPDHLFSRVFVSTSFHRKDDSRLQTVQQETAAKAQRAESIQLESSARKEPTDPGQQGNLLSEQVISNQEQRKADWAIIKEMSRYLWPKVGWVIEVLRSSLSDIVRVNGEHDLELGCLLGCLWAQRSPSFPSRRSHVHMLIVPAIGP